MAAERHRRFGPIEGQGLQPLALPAGQDDATGRGGGRRAPACPQHARNVGCCRCAVPERHPVESPRVPDADLWRFGEGTHDDSGRVLGAHPTEGGGTVFRVWAPNAASVSVIGDFNDWNAGRRPADRDRPRASGRGASPTPTVGERYKYRIATADGTGLDKADPVAFASRGAARDGLGRRRPRPTTGATASGWPAGPQPTRHDAPMSIYEVHLGSWRYEPGGYRALAHQLADYLRRHRVHPRRTAPDHGAPVLRVVGLPDHRLLRAHRPLRLARRT